MDCFAPRPSEVARPNNVANMASVSIREAFAL